MSKALEGIKVLELTHVISGPVCGMLLGDLGAEIIKVERPGTGEFYREEALKNADGISLIFPNYNRNKKSITLNYKAEEGREVLLRLVKWCDILVENFRPGLLNKMGLGYEALRGINPGLIMVSISGFGQTGPYAMKPAYDMTIAAYSGLMSLNGPAGQPTKTGPAVSDFLSGIYGALAAVAALRARERSGEGQYIDVAMLDCAMSILDAFFAQSHFTGVEPGGMGNRRANYAPVNAFQAKDGAVYIAATLQKHWEALTRLMGREDLTDDPRCANAIERKKYEPEVEGAVAAWTAGLSSAELIQMLETNGIPCAPVLGVKQARQDPHVRERASIMEFDYPGLGAYPVPAFPPRFSTLETSARRAPLLGEHDDEVYGGLLGYTQEQIAAWREKNII
ncbi:MAG: CoA transferase [Peptococcaceae bacterium]|jgi:crotonobetainyl-CoA:carnitine CoA-transferase CaiB-like acyl-CoA transferase|nr:CoA transferase [Peptococcaceae bacterium]